MELERLGLQMHYADVYISCAHVTKRALIYWLLLSKPKRQSCKVQTCDLIPIIQKFHLSHASTYH